MKTQNTTPSGRLILAGIAVLSLVSIGCSGARTPPNEKAVSPVTGTVHVDGAPLAGVRLKFHTKTPAATHRMFPKAMTDAEGKFVAWTYRKDDGLAAGDYTVTFLDHSQAPPNARESEKVDLFEGKYADEASSEFIITVPNTGEPLDVGTFELTR